MNLPVMFFYQLFGLNTPPQDLTLLQMGSRGVAVFIFGVFLVRFADRRFLGRNAGFDVLLGVVLGSVLSRGINGQAAFLPTLGVSFLLVVLHRVVSTLACRYHVVSLWLKGVPEIVVKNGQLDHRVLEKNKISAEDLDENLRLNGNTADVAGIEEARFERNGQVSVIRRK
ncbi:MAG: DUF421 domain-containing protein [Nibricoccus sp.]